MNIFSKSSRRVYVWPPCEEQYEEATQSLGLSFIIPSNVRPGDWCLIPPLSGLLPFVSRTDGNVNQDRPWPILLVRHGGVISQNRMQIVGKGFAYEMTTDLDSEINNTILFQNHWDAEDALVFASSFLPNGSLPSFLRSRLEDYMETGVCAKYSSSYVECIPRHVERMLSLSDNPRYHGFQDSSATHSVPG